MHVFPFNQVMLYHLHLNTFSRSSQSLAPLSATPLLFALAHRRPLNYAAFGGRIDAAKLLVSDRGASTDLKDKRSTISEDLVSYLFEYEGSRQRHGEVVSYLEAYKPTVT